MPRPLEIITQVSPDGKIPKKHSEHVRDHLKLYADGDVRIRLSRPKRTSRANRFYWAGIISPIRLAMIEAGIGFMETNEGIKAVTADAIHRYFKWNYLDPQIEVVFGEDFTYEPTTTTLDQTAFSDYIEHIKSDPQVRQLGVVFEDVPSDLRSYAIAEAA